MTEVFLHRWFVDHGTTRYSAGMASHSNRDITVCLLSYVVFDMLGTGMIPGIVMSFETTHGLSHSLMGTFLGIASGCAGLSGTVSGILADRYGAPRMLAFSMGAISLGALGIAFVPVKWGAVAALLFFVSANATTVPVNGLIVKLFGSTGSRGINLLHGLQGVGRLLAPLAAALFVPCYIYFTKKKRSVSPA